MNFNINSIEVVHLTNKLEKMHKSVLPRTVRDTLNYAALQDTKQDTMLKSAKKNFKDERTKLSFFKGNSKVKFANGWNVSKMKSNIGFYPKKKATEQSVENLEKQENGGIINGKSFIPLKQVRVASKWNRNVVDVYRLQKIKDKIVDSRDNSKGKNRGQKFIFTAYEQGVGGFVIGGKKGKRYLYEIQGITRQKGNTKIKAKPLYSVSGGRKVRPIPTKFMKEAKEESQGRIEKNFIKFANINIQKYKFR
jgi:hypothetical protein